MLKRSHMKSFSFNLFHCSGSLLGKVSSFNYWLVYDITVALVGVAEETPGWDIPQLLKNVRTHSVWRVQLFHICSPGRWEKSSQEILKSNRKCWWNIMHFFGQRLHVSGFLAPEQIYGPQEYFYVKRRHLCSPIAGFVDRETNSLNRTKDLGTRKIARLRRSCDSYLNYLSTSYETILNPLI